MNNFFISLFAFLITIAILVGIHEYGHYIVARLFKVGILKFSIGFGKVLYSYKSKKTGTIFAISAIPLGGYVKMLHENTLENNNNKEDIDSNILPKSNKYPQYSFQQIHPLKKISIILAGPCINFLAAILFFALVAMYGIKDIAPIIAQPAQNSILYQVGMQNKTKIKTIEYNNNEYKINGFNDISWHLQMAYASKENIKIATINQELNKIDIYNIDLKNIQSPQELLSNFIPAIDSIEINHVETNSLASKYGLLDGDKIIGIDNQEANFYIMSEKLKSYDNFNLNIERNKKLLNINIKAEGKLLGIHIKNSYKQVEFHYGLFDAIKYGYEKTYQTIISTISAIMQIFTDNKGANNIGGPIAISSMAKQSLVAGVDVFLQFLALISISLGVMNLIPLPVLDGGQALITLIEWIMKKPINPKFFIFMQKIGGVLILALTFLALKNDITNLFK